MTAPPPTREALFDAAARYHDAGMICVPLHPGHKRTDYDKLRATGHVNVFGVAGLGALRRRPPSDKDMTRWFDTPSNLGVATGYENLLVCDFDDAALYARWCAERPDIAGRTATQRSRRGFHVFLRSRRRIYDAKILDEEGRHCGEVLAGEVPVAVWPSVHPSGYCYAWVEGLAPWECGIATVDGLDDMGLVTRNTRSPGRRILDVIRTVLRGSPRHLWARLLFHAPRLPLVSRLLSEHRKSYWP